MTEIALVALAAAAVFVGAVLQRITGIGFGGASAPALILLLGPMGGVLALHALAALCSLVVLISCWRYVEWPRTIALTGIALAVTPLGVVLSFQLPGAVLQIATGAVMLAALFTVDVLARSWLMRGRLGVIAAGVLSGIANGTVAQAGPLVGAYAVASRWSMTSYVASTQVCWLLVNVAAVVMKGLPPVTPVVAGVLLGSVAVGLVVSVPIARRLSREAAVRCLMVVAAAGSVVLLGKGVAGLVWG
ncbi:MAG: TSUP family transporter [Microbacteriaceae bacterium]|nr:TSUP family transporter [Microbacteriaceae bacterium]